MISKLSLSTTPPVCKNAAIISSPRQAALSVLERRNILYMRNFCGDSFAIKSFKLLWQRSYNLNVDWTDNAMQAKKNIEVHYGIFSSAGSIPRNRRSTLRMALLVCSAKLKVRI
jgi:hypothetical protein